MKCASIGIAHWFAPVMLGWICVYPVCAEHIPVNNGSFGGPGVADVEYINVTQNSVTDPIVTPGDPGPYGEPVLVGNQLSFTAPSFAAIANPDQLHDTTDGFLGFRMKANEGQAITTLEVYEFGAVQMFSASGGSIQTRTSVLAPVFIEVTDVILSNGSILPVPDVMFTTGEIDITPNSGSSIGWNSLQVPPVTQWVGALEIDLVAEIAASYPDFVAQHNIVGVHSMSLTMNNILTAAVEEFASFALVDKKHTSVRPGVIAVPEPTSMGLFTVFAVAGLRLRRKPRENAC